MPDSTSLLVQGVPVRLYQHLPPVSPTSGNPVIVLLHGSGGNIQFWTARVAPLLEQAGIALIAPHYFDRTGTVRADLQTIQDGIHVPQWLSTVHEVLRHVAAMPEINPDRIILAGISLGAFLSLAYAADPPEQAPKLRGIVELSGGLVEPYRSKASTAFPPTLILHGTEDTIVPVSFAHDLAQKLSELQVPHTTELLQGEGHWFSPAALPRMLLALSKFLQSRLQG